MATGTSSPIVINATTEQHGWVSKMEQAMKAHQEIVLLAFPALNEAQQAEINRLSRSYQYHTPANLPESEWKEYERKLDLGGYAPKEQGITPNAFYVLRPQS